MRGASVLFLAILAVVLHLGEASAQPTDYVTELERISPDPQAGRIRVTQPWDVGQALQAMVRHNAEAPGMDGYRVRIYRNVGKQANVASQRLINSVMTMWPGLPVYRSYSAPYFRVTVGDCRTRHEASALLHLLTPHYPMAFVVAERINFPRLDTMSLEQRFSEKAWTREEQPE